MKIKPLPKPTQFVAWRNATRLTIASHISSQADEVLKWILKVEEPDTTIDSFADSGPFAELDIDLAAALVKIASGEIGREINLT